MWITKIWEFKTLRGKKTAHAKMEAWLDRNRHRIQFEEVFVNNGYGVTFRKLRRIG